MKKEIFITLLFLLCIGLLVAGCESNKAMATPTISDVHVSETQTAISLGPLGPEIPPELEGINLTSYIDKWTQFKNDDYGIAFEYPSIFDEVEYCKLQLNEESKNKLSIFLGTRIAIIAWKNSAITEKELIKQRTKGAKFVEIKDTNINREQAWLISYRYGELDRLAEETIVKKDDKLVEFSITVPAACNFGQANIDEFTALDHILETFHFTK